MKKLVLLFVFCILFISLVYSFEAKNLLINPDFELNDLSAWVVKGGEISRSDSPIFEGKYSLRIAQRVENEDGVFQDITDKVAPGYVYTVSGQTRTGENDWDKLAVYLVLSEGTKEKQIFLGSSDARNTGWARFSYKFTIPERGEISKFGLLFRPSFSPTDFYLDGLLLEPSIQIKTSSDKRGTKLSVNIGPLTDDQRGLKAELKVQDVRDNNVFTSTLSLAESTLINLKDGFYHAGADVVGAGREKISVEKTFCAGDLSANVNSLIKTNQKLTGDSGKAAYHGWLKYLQYLLEDAKERFSENIDGVTNAAYRLQKWAVKVQENDNLIDAFTGVIEWAYLSKVDDSGQPFKLAIPTDYTPNKSFALEVDLHGHGGNHMEYSGGVRSQPDRFQLHVLGRARGGWFSDLSEVDVLDAIKYVEKHWNIDSQKIHLIGRSMGGWGTFNLCTRHPDIFASARPQCGLAVVIPIENMLHVPVYSVHSIDDPTVPVLQDRAPIQNLIRFGGKVILDETSGLGHAAWNYNEGNTRAYEFAFSHTLPEMKDVRRIHYTAMDGFARRAYWLEVDQWGQEPRPAIFDARIDGANVLYLNLENINILKIDVGQSPINIKENLKVVINGKYPLIYNAPLAETFYVKLQEDTWTVSDIKNKYSYRLHYPGGADLLYRGEPLMIVWGTNADPETNKRMYDAAQAARKSCYPSWPDADANDPGEGAGIDGIPHNRLLYSTLLGKPDSEVSESDIRKYNLVLIGTAEQNSIVAKIADKLPVQLRRKSVKCSDGVNWKVEDAVIGLCHYNPEAAERLIFWIASENPEFYEPESEVLYSMLSFEDMPDLVIASLKCEEVIASRSFDSHWQWESNYKKSPFFSPRIRNEKQLDQELAKVFMRALGGDMSIISISEDSNTPSYRIGRRRIADLKAHYYYMPLAEMTLSGKKVMAYQEWFKEHPNEYGQFEFYPRPNKFTLKEDRLYRICIPPYVIWDMRGIIVQQPPEDYRITDIQARDAIEKYFPTSLPRHRKTTK